MNKKTWSIILLCLIIISFIFTAITFVNTGISIYELENVELSSSADKLPLSSVIGVAFASVALWGGFVLISGSAASVGFLSSLINTKISQNAIYRISKISLYFFSVILFLVFGIMVYFLVSILG